MTTEKKVRQSKKKNVEPKEELVFTESTKEPCETCKEPKRTTSQVTEVYQRRNGLSYDYGQ